MRRFLLTIALLGTTAYSLNAQSLPPTSGPGPVDGTFRTQTIGGWGASPNGNNPGVLLHANFDTVFPDGVTIGSGDNVVVFTSAQAITDFLPSGGPPSAIGDSYIDPTTGELKNTFVSQTLALTVSLGFDAAIADFGESTGFLGDMVLAEGELAEKSVSEVLSLANATLSGVDTGYSVSELNATLSTINENYVDGEIDNGLLAPSATFTK